jgi:hypothetical protein
MTRSATFLSVALMFLMTEPAAAQETGSIRGTVLDETGTAIVGAKVNASPMNGGPTIKLVRYVETDRDGHFLIDRLEWGEYGVFAMKEETGYPNMGASLYSNDVFPKAKVSPSSPLAELRIQLGPKAGVITGSVTNVVNGAPLAAGFKLTRADSPDKWLSTSVASDYRVLIPSLTDVLLEVSVPGFLPWSPGHPLHLRPGVETHLDILLEPSHESRLHPSKFLVPEGYVGWLLLEYDLKGAKPVQIEGDTKIFKFAANGTLDTSSSGPERGAEDEYFYVSSDGSSHQIPTDYRNGKGMIWGKYEGTRNGALSQFGFFVGTEDQYRKFQTRKNRPGPIQVP